MNNCENVACRFNTGKGICTAANTTDAEGKYANTPQRWQELARGSGDVDPKTLRNNQVQNILEKTPRLIEANCRPEDTALKDALRRFKEVVGA
jgi:hypothetical protein